MRLEGTSLDQFIDRFNSKYKKSPHVWVRKDGSKGWKVKERSLLFRKGSVLKGYKETLQFFQEHKSALGSKRKFVSNVQKHLQSKKVRQYLKSDDKLLQLCASILTTKAEDRKIADATATKAKTDKKEGPALGKSLDKKKLEVVPLKEALVPKNREERPGSYDSFKGTFDCDLYFPKEKKSIAFHRKLIDDRIPVFSRDYASGAKKRVEIANCTSQVFHDLMIYCYDFTLPDDEQRLWDLEILRERLDFKE